jgi:hypothetical protein
MAGGQGDVGVVDDAVVVRATEATRGERAGAASGCTYEVVIQDDRARGVYELDGARTYSDTGRWLRKICDGAVVDVGGLFFFPEGSAYGATDVLADAINRLDPRPPLWGSSPDGVDVPMVTQMPTWLWVEPSYWNGSFVVRAESPSGRVWAEARAVPVSASWNVGNGTSVPCGGPGMPFSETAESGCTHVFEHSTAGTAGVSLSVTVTFDVLGTTSENPTPVSVGQLSRTSPPVVVTVGEIQAIETGGR